jgi:hypothetical protein
MPDGIKRAGERNPTNFSLAEWQQAKRSGLDPRWLKETVQLCWNASDSAPAFHAALKSYALTLAAGDRRGFVVVDFSGEVHSLTRLLGKKTDILNRLLSGPTLPTVAEAKAANAARMTPAVKNHIREARALFQSRAAKLGDYKKEMTTLHHAERGKLATRHQREWDEETRTRAARLPKGLRGLWHRITGQYQRQRAINEAEAKVTQLRHASERDTLTFRQLDQRSLLQGKIKELRAQQAALLLELRRDIARLSGLAKNRERDRVLGLSLKR